MRDPLLGRRVCTVAAATALAVAGVLVGPATPAHAAGTPIRHEDTSDHDGQRVKSAVARCDDNQRLLATGGKINGGRGGVLLAALEPDLEHNTVTATARAAEDVGDNWSVTAYAVCSVAVFRPKLAVDVATGGRAAVARCDADTQLLGTAFRVTGAVGNVFLDEVSPDEHATRLRVHASGAPLSVTAIAICYPEPLSARRFEATVALDGVWPKNAVVDATLPTPAAYWGVGGRIDQAPGAFLDAFVPDPAHGRVGVRAAKRQPASAGSGLTAWSSDGDGGTVKGEGIGGTFH